MSNSALTKNVQTNGYILKAQSNTKYNITHNDSINPLGKGAFGTVYKSENTFGIFVIKQIPKCVSENIQLEYTIMKQIKEKGVYNLVIALDFAEDDIHFYIIMPFYNEGNLTRFITRGKITSELEAIEYFRQICYGVLKLHKYGVIHRDLKTDNILISTYNDPSYPYNYYFVVGDLGLAKRKKRDELVSTMGVGTAMTSAPEVSTGVYDFRADVYSLGCILYKMLSNAELFHGSTLNEISDSKKVTCHTINSKFGPLSKFTLKLLEDCLQFSPHNRMPVNILYKKMRLKEFYTQYEPIVLDEISDKQILNLNKKENSNEFIKYSMALITPQKKSAAVIPLSIRNSQENMSDIESLKTEINLEELCTFIHITPDEEVKNVVTNNQYQKKLKICSNVLNESLITKVSNTSKFISVNKSLTPYQATAKKKSMVKQHQARSHKIAKRILQINILSIQENENEDNNAKIDE